MSVFLDIADQHRLSDTVFAQSIVVATNSIDQTGFEQGWDVRDRNDQAYFLFLFTRLEEKINEAFSELLSVRNVGIWSDRRPWSVWDGKKLSDIALMQKVSLLPEKGHSDYNEVERYYDGRNAIAHGDLYKEIFVIQLVAERMHKIVLNFVRS